MELKDFASLSARLYGLEPEPFHALLCREGVSADDWQATSRRFHRQLGEDAALYARYLALFREALAARVGPVRDLSEDEYVRAQALQRIGRPPEHELSPAASLSAAYRWLDHLSDPKLAARMEVRVQLEAARTSGAYVVQPLPPPALATLLRSLQGHAAEDPARVLRLLRRPDGLRPRAAAREDRRARGRPALPDPGGGRARGAAPHLEAAAAGRVGAGLGVGVPDRHGAVPGELAAAPAGAGVPRRALGLLGGDLPGGGGGPALQKARRKAEDAWLAAVGRDARLETRARTSRLELGPRDSSLGLGARYSRLELELETRLPESRSSMRGVGAGVGPGSSDAGMGHRASTWGGAQGAGRRRRGLARRCGE
jgi:hypothetical protein